MDQVSGWEPAPTSDAVVTLVAHLHLSTRQKSLLGFVQTLCVGAVSSHAREAGVCKQRRLRNQGSSLRPQPRASRRSPA